MTAKGIKSDAASAESGISMRMLPLDQLQEQCGISGPVFAGVCAANGWRRGKEMTKEDFLRAVTNFAKAPMGRDKEREGKSSA